MYIHIPKTGGTSIETLFLPTAECKDVPGGKHRTLRSYDRNFYLLKDYFKFTFVRNPWDLTLSMYSYLWRSQDKWPRRWRKSRPASITELSFLEWIKHETFRTPTLRSIHAGRRSGHCADGTQLDWISSKKTSLDFIGRFENLQQDFNTVCDKIKIPQQQLPHINKTNHKHYTEYYDDETREIVAEKYAKDIEYFGYKFG